jgi:hypothetical protein
MSTVDQQLMQFRRALCVPSDAQLAKLLGYTAANVSAWRARGSIPQSALRRIEAVVRLQAKAAAADLRRSELSEPIMNAGLQLVLWLAPSRDAVPDRISPLSYTGMMLEFAALFKEIHLAAAEEVAAVVASQPHLTPHQAYERLTEQPIKELYARVIDRARFWQGDVGELLEDDD